MNHLTDLSKDDQQIELQHRKRLQALSQTRQQIQTLDSDEALNAVLSARQPIALVHSFPEAELHILVHEIGLEDCLPVLSLAANRQWQYLLDYETWTGDRWDAFNYIEWIGRLLEADSNRLIDWLLDEPQESLSLFLSRYIHVQVREHDQSLSDIDSAYLTFDDVVYFRILIPEPDETEEDDYRQVPAWADIVVNLLKHLAEADHVRYQQLLLDSTGILDAEMEEEAYRLRCVRMSEKGFMAQEEAVGIFQPISLKRLSEQVLGKNWLRRETAEAGVSVLPARLLTLDASVSDHLERLLSPEMKAAFPSEFAVLCNRLISAEGFQVRSREGISRIVKRAASMIRLGIDVMIDAGTGRTGVVSDTEEPMLTAVPLQELFRAGNSCLFQLKQDAERWVAASWFRKKHLPLRFWGEQGMGTLGGLLAVIPVFFDNFNTEPSMYREFRSLSDVEAARIQLDFLKTLDSVLSKVINRADWIRKRETSAEAVLYTRWALCRAGATAAERPLTPEEAVSAFQSLWIPEQFPRQIDPSTEESIKEWLLSYDVEVDAAFMNWLNASLSAIADEYCQVENGAIDSRYFQFFCVSQPIEI